MAKKQAKKKKATTKVKKKLSTLERVIASQKHSVERLRGKKTRLRAETEEECREIDREIGSRRVILRALVRGELRP